MLNLKRPSSYTAFASMTRSPSTAGSPNPKNTPLPLKALVAFEAVARLGSVAKAADELRVTPSAVSHQLKAFQDVIGVKLIATARGRALLTADGERFASELIAGMSVVRAAYHRVKPDRAFVMEVKPLLALALGIAPTQNAPALDGILARVASPPAGSDLGAADAALRLGTHPAPDTTAFSIGSLPVALFSEPSLRPSDLTETVLLASSDWPQEEAIVRAAFGLSIKMYTFETLSDVVLAGENGQGIALLPVALVRRQVRTGTLKPVRIGAAAFPPCPVTLHVRTASSAMRKAKALAQVWRRMICDLAQTSPI